MRIYFAGSISGGRQYVQTYVYILTSLRKWGYDVHSDHVADSCVLTLDENRAAKRIFARDMKQLAECDVVIAEVTNTSFVVGFELCHALHLGKRVLCLYHSGRRVPRIIRGITMPGLVIREYGDKLQLHNLLADYLDSTFECIA